MSRAKAWLPELDPVDLALGYPSLKEDDNAFDDHDFTSCVKAIRPVATLIGNDTDLSKYAPVMTVRTRESQTLHMIKSA